MRDPDNTVFGATNWWCKVCGWRWYVRPDKWKFRSHTDCPACGSSDTERNIEGS